MNRRSVWVTTMTCLFSFNCFRGPEPRLLVVGGIHVFEGQAPCRLVRVEPEGAVKNLDWTDTLALEAKSEGTAEVMCGTEKFMMKIVAPARLEIEVIGDGKSTEMAVHKRLKVLARLYDRKGRELEIGKFTIFEWASSEVFEVANDRSAGEFGFCDTCYGMHNFRAVKSGKGSIVAQLGVLQGKLTVEIKP